MRLTAAKDPERIRRYEHIRPASRWRGVRCSVKCPGTAHACTREMRHRGPHVAHGVFRRALAVWDEADAIGGAGPGTGPEEAGRRKRAVRRKPNRDGGWIASLGQRWSHLVRRAPSVETTLLAVLGLGMVWFAIDVALRILGWR